jgi:signal transduction histidine kinase
LKGSYEELEHRVAARTRELGAFFDLAMLGDARQGLDETLAHALRRIADAGGCSAVCLHLAAEDAQDLDLVAHAGIAAQALAELRSAPLDGEWVARRCEAEQPWVPREPFPETALPPALRVPGSRHYLGTSLGCGTGVRGWLSCYCRDGTGFGVSEASLLAALARQIGVIVENHRLQQITGQLAALEERQRLARDLHDSVTQLMYGLGLFSRAARDAIADGDAVRATSNLEKVGDTAELALREMRSLLFELQPPAVEEVGLAHALEQRLDLVERRLGIRVRDHIDDAIALPSAVARELYMVAMECLNNALKHARAEELRVSLVRSNGAVEMSIADNGCGFDPALVSRGLGLSNVARRVARIGGELRLEAAVGSGARITVTVPVATAVAAKCLSGRAL